MFRRLAAIGVMLCLAPAASALDRSGPRINAPQARTLLGNGTGVIVGIIDSGIDPYHPALAGNDSLGRPRLVAQANFVPTEPANTGLDVYGHGTAVAGVILSADPTYRGIAPDARFVNARVLDSKNLFQYDDWVINGTGFALQNGAEILNLSLSYSSISSDASGKLSLMADWISDQLRIPIVVSAGNNGALPDPGHTTRGPGDGFNVFSTAASRYLDFAQVAAFSSWGATSDGRIKPDITAPGESISTCNVNWTGTNPDFTAWTGTSFAAPHITGMLALARGYGKTRGLSTDPMVLKVAILSSAEKINDRDGNAWAPLSASLASGVYTATQPLDDQSGAGQVDGRRFAQLYASGQHAAGATEPGAGWDLGAIAGISYKDYTLGQLQVGSNLSVALNWMRHVGRVDDGNGLLDAADSFSVLEALDNLDLTILRDGVPIAASASMVDNTEYLSILIDQPGQYTLRVDRKDVPGSGAGEDYAIGWFGTQVPEPGLTSLIAAALAVISTRSRRGRPTPSP